jgi:hypothetical protein
VAPIVDTVAAILPSGGATAATKVTVIIGRGRGDRRGSASNVSSTNRMTTIAEEGIPNLLVIDKSTSTAHTDLSHLEVPPPREILKGSTATTTRRDANSAAKMLT